MPTPRDSRPPPPAPVRTRFTPTLAGMLLAVVTVLVYLNTFSVPFVFDDLATLIDENPTIRQLWPLSIPLSPPTGGLTVSGRPLLNLSFALNYAAGGLDPFGYHVGNLLIHVLATLTLFGLVRRTLLRTPLRARFGGAATPVAATATALWALHPLLTESVTYIVQRAESLAALLYLLTLYTFVRATAAGGRDTAAPGLAVPPPDVTGAAISAAGTAAPASASNASDFSSSSSSSHPPSEAAHFPTRARPAPSGAPGAPAGDRRCLAAAVLACLLGMAAKETAASAPLLVLLYDRTFVSGSFREALRARRWFYVALASTWLLLAWLILGTHDRGGSAGFGLPVSTWRYFLTQCGGIVLYLKLAFWPHPLVFDYGNGAVTAFAAVWRQAALLSLLGLATVGAIVRRSPWGFAGAWFFALLAPSSSFVPVATQTLAEHRMYLPLAGVVVPLALLAWARFGRPALATAALLAVVLGGLTLARNHDYRTAVALWRDTVGKLPGSARAHNNLGYCLLQAGRAAEALPHFERARELHPAGRGTHFNLACALQLLDRLPEALAEFELAVQAEPDAANVHFKYAEALADAGRLDDARRHADRALQLVPDSAAAHNALGIVLARSGDHRRALDEFALARRLDPGQPDAQTNYGNALRLLGRIDDAITAYERSLAASPTFDAASNLGRALLDAGRTDDAIARFEAALKLAPDRPDAHANLGLALARAGRSAEALPHFLAALNLRSDDAPTWSNLGNTYYQLDRLKDAIACYDRALQLAPSAGLHNNIGNTFLRAGQPADAVTHYEAALALRPDFPEAHANLALALARLGRTAEAIAHNEAALRLKPDYADARRQLEELRKQ